MASHCAQDGGDNSVMSYKDSCTGESIYLLAGSRLGSIVEYFTQEDEGKKVYKRGT
jgi:hypothetical protein